MDRNLAALAAAYGVATWYEDSDHRRRAVSPDTVAGVLALLDVDAGSAAAVRASLAEARASSDPARLPPTVVVRSGSVRRLPGEGVVELADGGHRAVGDQVPADLSLGWHRLFCGNQEATLVVVPRRLPAPPPTWGWMLQLYALRSAGSWGMGDFVDLTDFAGWAGQQAGFVLVNPLHAIAPTQPVLASPYSPSSRLFANPLYVRVSETDAFREADADLRRRVTALRPPDRDLIDYDAVWAAKLAALELLQPPADESDLSGDRRLAAFATYCALAERHGPDWRTWPDGLRSPDGAEVAVAEAELADRVRLHAWLQRLCEQQLGAANAAARDAGMPIGIIHDLAVGVDPGGADGWMLGDVLAAGVRVGAPPDAFNQLGQDWGLAAWRPDRLAETGYAAYRDMLRRILRSAGGLRVDHVAGLQRLWWIPPGAGPADGTYVRYDPDAMLGILALEARRAGAVVIGEDLGTVQPSLTRALRGRNMLGSTVLWFARDWTADGGPFIPPDEWPANAFASISTHDLPTARGFLAGEHVRVRADLGLLTSSLDDERARAADDRDRLIAMLLRRGLLDESGSADDGSSPNGGASEEDVVVAMHAALAASRSRLIAASPYDVLGELRQPNLPGTTDQYPNWRIPLSDSFEDLRTDPRVANIAKLLTAARPRRRRAARAAGRASAGGSAPVAPRADGPADGVVPSD
jgi:4-alpha-glucanotransferase